MSGVYPAYISEEQYARNREQLRANMYNFVLRHPGAPREGTALVQGLVLCGRCGRRMQVQYSKQGPRYVCRDDAMRYATSTCRSFGQRYLDEAVCACFFEAVKPQYCSNKKNHVTKSGVLVKARRMKMFRTLEVKGRVFALDHSRIDAQVPLGEQNSAHTGEQMLNLLGQTRRVENLSDGSRSAQQSKWHARSSTDPGPSRLAGPNEP